jgi:phosphatidylserine synthase
VGAYCLSIYVIPSHTCCLLSLWCLSSVYHSVSHVSVPVGTVFLSLLLVSHIPYPGPVVLYLLFPVWLRLYVWR